MRTRPSVTHFASIDQQAFAAGTLLESPPDGRLDDLDFEGTWIPRGAGISYVGASFGEAGLSIGMRRRQEVLAFDPEAQLLTVAAGISLGRLYDYLLPRGFYLPIQPGHPQITAGACAACNVHGKNPQRDGVFADRVERLWLFHPDHGEQVLSRAENADLFDLTCGGFGLTGVIVALTLRVSRLPSTRVELRKFPVGSLRESADRLLSLRSEFDFLYTWNDLSRFDARLGEGYVATGRFVPGAAEDLSPLPAYPPLDPSRAARRWRPRVFGRAVIPLVCRLQLAWQMYRPVAESPLFEVLYPGLRYNFYFNLYGPAGFFGHMVLLPDDRRGPYLDGLERIARRHREPILVTSMKAFAGPQRLLHFNGTGVSMHFHVPNTPGGRDLIQGLEDLSRDLSVIRNIYFDARLDGSTAARLFPEYEQFRDRLHRYDPRRRFASTLSRRLGL